MRHARPNGPATDLVNDIFMPFLCLTYALALHAKSSHVVYFCLLIFTRRSIGTGYYGMDETGKECMRGVVVLCMGLDPEG